MKYADDAEEGYPPVATTARPRRAQAVERRHRWWLVLPIVAVLAAAGIWWFWPTSGEFTLRREPAVDLPDAPRPSGEWVTAAQPVPGGVVTVARAESTQVTLLIDGEQRWQQSYILDVDWRSVTVLDASEAGAYALYFSTVAVGAEPSGPLGAGDKSQVLWVGSSDGAELSRKDWPAHRAPVSSADGRLYSIDLRNGELASWIDLDEQRWSYQLPDFHRGDPQPRIHRNGSVLAVTADTSNDQRVDALVERESGRRVPWQIGGVTYLTNDALVGVTSDSLKGFDWSSGRQSWTRPWAGEGIRVSGGELFLSSQAPSGEVSVVAIDTASGEQRWDQALRGAQWIDVVGDNVVVRSNEEIFVGELASGDGRWLPSAPGQSAALGRDPIVARTMYYCVGLDENGLVVTARSLADGAELWTARPDAAFLDDVGGLLWGTGSDENRAYRRFG